MAERALEGTGARKMSGSAPVVAMRLHRLEVHATSATEEFPELRWTVWATGGEDAMVVSGYLASVSTDGYGQAQVIALLSDYEFSDIAASGSASDEFRAWARRHVTDSMYHVARRALQSQAAQMDFTFVLPLEAPEVEIEIDTILVES